MVFELMIYKVVVDNALTHCSLLLGNNLKKIKQLYIYLIYCLFR